MGRETGSRIPATRTHATGSGGLHVLFRHTDGLRNSAGRIAPGVDVRGDGGYLIWWPDAGCKVLVCMPLAPWPQSLLSLVERPTQPTRPTFSAATEGHANAARRYALAALRNAVERVAAAGEAVTLGSQSLSKT